MVSPRSTLRLADVQRISKAISAVIVLTFLGSLLALGVALYQRSLSDARSMAVALEQFALRTLITGDLMSEAAGRYVLERGSLQNASRDPELRKLLSDMTARLPDGAGMIVVDPKGDVVAFDNSLLPSTVNLSDRAWFVAHHAGEDFIISPALMSRITHRIMFVITRAVRAPDGELVAIINWGIPSDALIGVRALPQYADRVMLTLLTGQGGLLARSSFPEDLLGQRFPQMVEKDDWASFVRTGDGWSGVAAVQADNAYGLVARADIPLTDVFQPLLYVAGIGLPVVLLVLLGTRHLLHTLLREHRFALSTSGRLEAILRASHLGSWHFDLHSGKTQVNARWFEILGEAPERYEFSMEDWTERLHPDERDTILAEGYDVISGKKDIYQTEHRLRHRDGHWVWVYDSGRVVERDENGTALAMTGTILDITERREAEQRVRVLMRELDHRSKNLIAVVYSMIGLMKGDTIEEFKTVLKGRVRALGTVHDLLSQSSWKGVQIDALVRKETAAYQSNNSPCVHQSGPEIVLNPGAAQAIAIVLHELMTNSAKYGALSAETGIVEIEWYRDDAHNTVHIFWRESGGPEVSAPVREGFGTTLLNLMVRDQLNGTLSVRWEKKGAVFKISMPSDQVQNISKAA